jgi:serine phosphatase RsbU (regulator of sigma subunit)
MRLLRDEVVVKDFGPKESLLIVDDEPANLQKLKRTFLNEFEVFEAQSGEKAIEFLKRRKFSVIITDQRMPGMSGVELLEMSRKSSPEAIRIILTGYTETEDLMDAINQGRVHRYVTKPWEPFSLKRTVIQDIEHSRLKRENQILTEQLRIAKEVQKTLFPQVLPKIPGLEYVGVCRQAKEVGGDYYDFLQFQPRKLVIAVGDASGKGIGSSLLMSGLQALIRSQAPSFGDSLAELVKSLNLLLLERIPEEKFVTLFIGIFDTRSNRLIYVNAGHNYPVILSEIDGDRRVRLLKSTGTIVGMFPSAVFGQEEISLKVGDVLAVFTDGLTDAWNESDELFGEDRLLDLFKDHYYLPLQELAELTIDEIENFSLNGEPNDDMTLVLARVKGKSTG